MKDWILGRRLMAEEGGAGGEGGGGGGGTGDQGGKGGEGGGTGDQGGDGDPDDTGKGEEEHNNALGDELNKGGEGDQGGKGGEQQPEKKDPPPDPNAPTEEEVKAYNDAIKLDEEAFGKGAKLHETYAAQLPAFFKKHGIAADKANAIVNDFVKMQKEAEKENTDKVAKFNEWRQGELKKMNDAYHANYDKAGREHIARGITHFFKPGTPMYQTICRTEVGVDPAFLEAMKFIGERLPGNAAPGATAGAGSTGAKSISDSFMGI